MTPITDPHTKISNARDEARQNQTCTIDNWDSNNQLFKSVIEKYGVRHQVELFTEECGETLVAMSKYRRGCAGSVAVVEELVDLTIMISQMRMIYDPCNTEFDVIYNYKINRLKKILEAK